VYTIDNDNFDNNNFDNDNEFKDYEDYDNLQSVFIEDSFYLTDNDYIYDKSTYNKVGYVEKIDNKIVYQLSDDPFVLNSI
jgi:hypothetical protein